MLGAIAWMYRKVLEATELKGLSNDWQLARALGTSPEQAQIALQSARRISKARLLDGLLALRKADDLLKHGGRAPRAVLEFLVSELAGKPGGSRAIARG